MSREAVPLVLVALIALGVVCLVAGAQRIGRQKNLLGIGLYALGGFFVTTAVGIFLAYVVFP